MVEKSKAFILWFKDVAVTDVSLVGGKIAGVGEMFNNLSQLGVNVPDGFVLTAYACDTFFTRTGLKEKIKDILIGLETKKVADLQKRGKLVRQLIMKEELPEDLKIEVVTAYRELSKIYKAKDVDVAVRSSMISDKLTSASFVGQQETFLNVTGEEQILKDVKSCYASLFNDRAISYRADQGFSIFDILLAVGVQKMARSDMGSSGIAFSLDTETGFDKVVVINGAYGLGKMVTFGQVIPDEFIVFKPSLERGMGAILSKTLGQKEQKLVYGKKGTVYVKVPKAEQDKFCLTNDEIIQLSTWIMLIEKYFSSKAGKYQPMNAEWAKDGKTGGLFVVEAVPETGLSGQDKNVYKEYRLDKSAQKATSAKGFGEPRKEIVRGIAVGTRISSGKVHIIKNVKQISSFKPGEILVTEITDPDWGPIMKMAGGIIAEKGGRTSHSAIISRELGVPCIVGANGATKVLKNGDVITIDCSSGKNGIVYQGKLAFQVLEHRLDKVPKTHTKMLVNIGSPEEAMANYYLPVEGVGLGRLEFIISSYIKIHPNALINFVKIKKNKDAKSKKLVKQIDELTREYGDKDKKEYYINELVEGVATIGAAFWPKEVIIRFSDFKTNEYSTLIGGEDYEPHEENPMLGWRGASRYYDPKFKEAFSLEVKAFKKVREEIGLTNVVPMIPFCRTIEEAEAVIEVLRENGLDRNKDQELKIYMMCEIPSNILLADDFLKIFDGMSIGSNDLSQLTLGLDRDSNLVSHIANENNPAVKKQILEVIEKCRAKGKYIGICGQAPSDYPEFAEFLVKAGISSMSLNPDVIMKMLSVVELAEKRITGG
ncbi:MAG: phosphoenolpyruvate synthase [Candidatus Vogelbacteria bacterium]|nr:phosphoenolpyruvate synthase [Candidatus Vogelbacteria bacterium]